MGFCNGIFHRVKNLENKEFNHDFLDYLKVGATNAIELHCNDKNTINFLIDNRDLSFSDFTRVSFHMSALDQKEDENFSRDISKLTRLKEKFDIKNFVFHTDEIFSLEIFGKYRDLPISIENMDNRKSFGKTVEDLKLILNKYPFGLTLDLQHCFVNDPSMKLAADFQETFKERIVEYHISGFDAQHNHYPLYKTKQDIIIDSLKYQDIPIIIESTFDEIGEQKKELKYIKSRLNNQMSAKL